MLQLNDTGTNMLNTKEFEKALYEDGKNVFEKIITKHGNNIYVIGLYHFGGYDGVMPVFNTLTDLKEVLENFSGNDIPLIEYTAKWNPSDYLSLEEYSQYFKNSEKEIKKLGGRWEDTIYESNNDSQNRWQQTLRAMERVLIRLDKEGVFSTGVNRENITLTISTYDEGEDEQYDRIIRLNPDTVLNKIKSDFEMMISYRAKCEAAALDKVKSNHIRTAERNQK